MAHRMYHSLLYLLPAMVVTCLFCNTQDLKAMAATAHRKLYFPESRHVHAVANGRRTLLTSSANFYNAFDTSFPNSGVINPKDAQNHAEYEGKDAFISSEFNAEEYPPRGYGSNAELSFVSPEFQLSPAKELNAENRDVSKEGENGSIKKEAYGSIDTFSGDQNRHSFHGSLDSTDKAQKDQFYDPKYNYHNAVNVPDNDAFGRHYNGAQYVDHEGFQFSSPSSSGSRSPSPYGDEYNGALGHQGNGEQNDQHTEYQVPFPSSSRSPFPYSDKFPGSFFDVPSSNRLTPTNDKKNFPLTDQQGLYNSAPETKRSWENRPTTDASAFEDQNLSRSPSSSSAMSKDNGSFSNYKELNHNSRAPTFDFKNYKPVSNYDSFFNSPTVYKDDINASQFPLDEHDVTYGHVQAP
ncbi:hypothetical protein KP509_14G052900 [Ceratopteris richardii]|uniref:Uncharacterized protein n=1 Tax=Ceratopteris richardii TaxID=49495 RepID=A0A8T2TA60_CERRI|nr:hypothetical protein KP509_14G052900 [Ceratopteris richardii]